ncbi:hypothetical protein AMTR_s00039p00172950 [Amborella trichopoda]|uniref:Cytochrome P450 n=2 Tax=Amborella trichopoda TaxID=13333 RepID=U5D094_AMBTC|nr:hypothetical protein AMTR_s00039p00172950 [Amborella trichopoda]
MQSIAGLWPWIQACLAILTLITILMLLLRSNKKSVKLNLPPGPRRLPIIGNLHQLGVSPHLSLARLSQKHGPLRLLQLGHVPNLVVSSAEMAKEVMKTQDLAFASRPMLVALKQLAYNCSDLAFAPYGEYWKQARKICVLQLLSLKKVQAFHSIREEEVACMVRTISSSCGDGGGGALNLTKMLHTYTNNIVSRVALGKKYYSNGEHGKYNFKDILDDMAILGSFCVGDFFPRMEWVDILTGFQTRLKNSSRDLDDFSPN